MTRTALYDLLIEGELVYVGVSRSPSRRLSGHRGRGFPLTTRMRVVRWYDFRADALAAERRRIEKLKPRLNVVYVVSRGPSSKQRKELLRLEEYAAAWNKLHEAAAEALSGVSHSTIYNWTRGPGRKKKKPPG